MGYRKVSIGAVEVLFCVPERIATRVKTLGGVLAHTPRIAPADEKAPQVLVAPAVAPGAQPTLQQRVAAIEWYHTIDLGDGLATPGWFDLRPMLPHYPLPERMDGMRVLDVATFDGFWAFEFERRGAAEVVALDIDSFAEVDMAPRIRREKDPAYFARRTGQGFALAKEIRKSRVRREVCNVYDLSPERLGKFDFVFISDVLLHLMNPMKALNNVASVTGGRAMIVDVFNRNLPGRLMSYESGVNHNTWWELSFGALEQMIRDAGFSSVELKKLIPLGYANSSPVMSQAAFEARA